jgi:hypothetical protein
MWWAEVEKWQVALTRSAVDALVVAVGVETQTAGKKKQQ